MSARVRFFTFLKRNAHEVADAFRVAHLHGAALSLAYSKRRLEKAKDDLADAFAAYDRAQAEYRLHQEQTDKPQALRIPTYFQKGNSQWQQPTEAPSLQSKPPRKKATLKTV